MQRWKVSRRRNGQKGRDREEERKRGEEAKEAKADERILGYARYAKIIRSRFVLGYISDLQRVLSVRLPMMMMPLIMLLLVLRLVLIALLLVLLRRYRFQNVISPLFRDELLTRTLHRIHRQTWILYHSIGSLCAAKTAAIIPVSFHYKLCKYAPPHETVLSPDRSLWRDLRFVKMRFRDFISIESISSPILSQSRI
jgi:hypothetical protein